MKGIFKWMNSQVNYLTSTVMDFTSQVVFSEYVQDQYQTIAVQADHFKQQIEQSVDIKDYADNLKKQAWLSINILNNPELIKVIRKSKEARHYINQLMIINGGMLALAILNELFLKAVMGEAYENEQDSYLESTLKILSWFLITRLDFQFMFDKLAHTWSAAFIVTQDFPNNKNHKDCECILFNKIKCAPDKIIDYLAMRGETYLLMKCFGNYALFLEAMRIGMDLMSYKLDSTGKCVRHQREVLNSNKVYCLMVGGAFLTLVNLFSWQVARTLNIDKDSLYVQVYSLLYPLFVLSMLTQKKAFINQKNGWDLFKYSRLVLKNVLKDVIAQVNAMLKNPNKGHTYEKIRAALAQSVVARNIKKLLLPADLQTLHLAVTRPAINEMVLLHAPGMKAAIKTIGSINSIPGSSMIPAVADLLPKSVLSDTGAVLTKLLFDDNLNKLLVELSSLIAEAEKHKGLVDRMKDIHKDFYTPSSSSALTKNWVNLDEALEEETQQKLNFILAGNELLEKKEVEEEAKPSTTQDQMSEYTKALVLSAGPKSRLFEKRIDEKLVGAALEDKLQCQPINIEQ